MIRSKLNSVFIKTLFYVKQRNVQLNLTLAKYYEFQSEQRQIAYYNIRYPHKMLGNQFQYKLSITKFLMY